jgi:hypothetical protein
VTKRVLILGCGPSGLLAAHAARLVGNTKVVIVSVKRPSQLFGCQYLHEDIPGLPVGPPTFVDYRLVGTAEEYGVKVYGPDEARGLTVSPEKFLGLHRAYDIRKAYRELWRLYNGSVDDHRITSADVDGMLGYYQPDLVFSSIPKPLICTDPAHDFRSTKCWAIGDAPELGQHAPELAPPETVICDGTNAVGWYRASNVFGYNTIEWPGWRSKPPVEGVVDFLKPLSNTCTCWPDIVPIGRMGEWRKGVLSHHALEKALIRLSNPSPAPANPPTG